MEFELKKQSLGSLIGELPELYQPIYGHPEHGGASRPTNDRLAYILKAAEALSALLGRRLRILDIGCAQGFISLNLARAGHEVKGIDISERNIALCQALADEHPDLKAVFITEALEHFIEMMEPGAFDLVLGLSIFHHVAYARGFGEATRLITLTAQRSYAAIYELGLSSEPLYWSRALPDDHESFLEGYFFIHELARFPTHLSEHQRPMLFASTHCWYFGDQCEAFLFHTTEPHRLGNPANFGTRRYYFSSSRFAKRFRLARGQAGHNLDELMREAEFLETNGKELGYPIVIAYGSNGNEAWLVRDKMDGEILLDAINNKRELDHDVIIMDILKEAGALKAKGLYHSDISTWNVLIKPDGHATLIDYGAVITEERYCVWPYDPFQAFTLFLHELTTGPKPRTIPLRRPYVSPANLPEKYMQWLYVCRMIAEGWQPEIYRTLFHSTPWNGSMVNRADQVEWQRSMSVHIDELGDKLAELGQYVSRIVAEINSDNAEIRKQINELYRCIQNLRPQK